MHRQYVHRGSIAFFNVFFFSRSLMEITVGTVNKSFSITYFIHIRSVSRLRRTKPAFLGEKNDYSLCNNVYIPFEFFK